MVVKVVDHVGHAGFLCAAVNQPQSVTQADVVFAEIAQHVQTGYAGAFVVRGTAPVQPAVLDVGFIGRVIPAGVFRHHIKVRGDGQLFVRFAAQQHAAAVVLVILGFKAIALSKREGGVEDMGAALAVGMRAFLRLTDTADAYQRG